MKDKTMTLWVLITLLGASILVTGCEYDAAKQRVSKQVPEAKTIKKQQSKQVNETIVIEDNEAELKALGENAKKITRVFANSLKSELQKAMENGGPVNALTICNTTAIPITEKVAEEKGVQLSRVSLKNRNPANAPIDWQKTVLENFDARAAKGEDVKTMVYAKIIEEHGIRQFRFMKALPTSEICLTCHGSKLTPDLSSKLIELYPYDKATGYTLRQIRGAVVIVHDIGRTH